MAADQTPQTICQALSEMKPEADYENLADEGFARTYIDWLYGVNLTRYATLKTGTLLRVGRVIVPIVKAVYDRDMSIKNFKKDKYYAVVSKTQVDGCTVELVSKRKFTKDELAAAQKLCDEYNAADTVVTAVKRKRETLSAGKLYSLSKLQNFLGKKYKMSMDDSLAAAQNYTKTDTDLPPQQFGVFGRCRKKQDKIHYCLRCQAGLPGRIQGGQKYI